MSLSSICVVRNALRLNLVDIHNARRDHPLHHKHRKSEETVMKKTLFITGMMCAHCENHVKTALEALPGVESALVSKDSGTAEVVLSQPVADDVLTKAVTDGGYEVTEIR